MRHRRALNAWRALAETSDTAGRDGQESLLINNLLYDAGGEMEVVPRMTYLHRMTDDSFFRSQDANRRRKEGDNRNACQGRVGCGR